MTKVVGVAIPPPPPPPPPPMLESVISVNPFALLFYSKTTLKGRGMGNVDSYEQCPKNLPKIVGKLNEIVSFSKARETR